MLPIREEYLYVTGYDVRDDAKTATPQPALARMAHATVLVGVFIRRTVVVNRMMTSHECIDALM